MKRFSGGFAAGAELTDAESHVPPEAIDAWDDRDGEEEEEQEDRDQASRPSGGVGKGIA